MDVAIGALLLRADQSLWDSTTAEVRDQIASISPTPGGGSASIITATLGAALLQKGTAISLKRSASDHTRHQNLLDLGVKIASVIDTLTRLADADSRAFQGYLKSRALPHTTETEKLARKASIQENLAHATQIPLQSAGEMVLALDLAETALKLADGQVLTDIFAGALLLNASITSVLLNVDINLHDISDDEQHKAMKQKRINLEHTATLRAESVKQEFETRTVALR